MKKSLSLLSLLCALPLAAMETLDLDGLWDFRLEAVKGKGGAVTLDLNITIPEGLLCPAQVEAFKEIR